MEHSYCADFGAVELHPLVEREVGDLRRLRNKNRNQFIFSGDISLEEQHMWYSKYIKTSGDYIFSIYYKGHWIGAVSIYDVAEGYAKFGRFLIDRKAAGRGGLGVDATKAACQIAFEQLKLHTIWLEVYCDNPAAQITYLKAGFRPVSIVENDGQRPMVHMVLSKN